MDGWKVKWSARKLLAKEMNGIKITRQRDGRMESYMVDRRITCQEMDEGRFD